MGNAYLDKRKAAGPFLPKWSQVKGRYKALGNSSIFKPDITPIISRYDQCLKDYDDLLKEQDKLKDVIVQLRKKNSENAADIKKLGEEIAQMTRKAFDTFGKNNTLLDKFIGTSGGDFDGASDALTTNAAAAEDFVNERKKRWEEMDGIAFENLLLAKKARDEFKAKADAMKSDMKKLEDTTYKCAGEIGETFVDYLNIASDIDHDDIAKDIKALVAKF